MSKPITRDSVDGMLRTERLGVVLDMLRSHAADRVPEPRTCEIVLWDDGDLQARVFHNADAIYNPDGIRPHQERQEVYYDPAEDQIRYRDYIDRGRTNDIREEEVVQDGVFPEPIEVVERDYDVTIRDPEEGADD